VSDDMRADAQEADAPADGPDGVPTGGPADGTTSSSDGSADPTTGGSVDGTDDAEAALAVDLEARAAADPRSRVELIAEIDGIESQRDEYLDDLRRSHADFDNYRKRVVRDAAVQRELGRSDVVSALLDVLDDLDRVVMAAGALDPEELSADVVAVSSGVQVVADKAGRALASLGVERLDVAGVPFDPTVHDAVQQVEGEGPGGPTVQEVLRPGYRLMDRVLRPAMVIVVQ
jgi:molecular chaperone GrpE